MPRKANNTPLTREAILQAAVELIRHEGIEAFSMRKLAALLGVNPMAVYYYLPNKEAILQAVVEQAMVVLPLPEAGDWQTAVRYAAEAYRHFAESQPELFIYMLTYHQSIPVAFSVDEYLATALVQTGLSAPDVVQVVYFVVNTIAGVTLSQINRLPGHTRDMNDVYQAFQTLPPEQFPTIHSLSQHLTPDSLRPDFEVAVAMLIAGVKARIVHITSTEQ
jgi:TetR/AcrR family transcriptional regulator, tetracycline repressor protein